MLGPSTHCTQSGRGEEDAARPGSTLRVHDLGDLQCREAASQRRSRRPARVAATASSVCELCRRRGEPVEACGALRPGCPVGEGLSHSDHRSALRAKGLSLRLCSNSLVGDRRESGAHSLWSDPGNRDHAPRFLWRETLEKPDNNHSITAHPSRRQGIMGVPSDRCQPCADHCPGLAAVGRTAASGPSSATAPG